MKKLSKPRAGDPRSPFGAVHALVRRIPRGRVATYGQLSRMLGGRLSAVGVGWALHALEDGAIPWHRVINSRGGLSTERDLPGVQRARLEAEGIAFDAAGGIDLAAYQWRPRSKRG